MKTIRMIGVNPDDHEQDLIDLDIEFTIKMSTYTTILQTDEIRWMFSDDFIEGNFDFVDAADKIKADVDLIAPEIDFVPEIELLYFDLNSNLADKVDLRRAYNVDIRNCYLSTAIKYGFISQETFDFCNTLKQKSDKHKAFGMLATNYTCFDCKGTDVLRSYSEVNERQRMYFFAVVSEISAVMQQIKSELNNDFLFYWVDGVYFKTKKAADRAQAILKENGFDSSFDILDNFQMTLDDGLRYIIKFGKRGEPSIFTVPKQQKSNYKARRIKELIKLATDNQYKKSNHGKEQETQKAQGASEKIKIIQSIG